MHHALSRGGLVVAAAAEAQAAGISQTADHPLHHPCLCWLQLLVQQLLLLVQWLLFLLRSGRLTHLWADPPWGRGSRHFP